MDTPGVLRQILIVPTPAGEVFTQHITKDLTRAERLVFACGRYEGIDVRIPGHYVSRDIEVHELSIGDYVLSGGEVATIIMIKTITRLLPGILSNPESLVEESHRVAGLLGYSIHARPIRRRGLEVNPVLLSSDHDRIARARQSQALARIVERRPSMIRVLDPAGLDREDRTLLARLGWTVPAGADHPVPMHLHSATADDAHALAELAARASPDVRGSVIDPEFLERHIAMNLVPELFATWTDDSHVDLILAELLEPPSVRDGDLEGGANTGAAPALVSCAAVLRGEADSDGEQPHGINPRPTCMRPAGGEIVGELPKVCVDTAMRGSGLAPALIGAVTRQADAHGTDLLWLGTHVTNKRAQKAYKRASFRQVGTRTYNVGGQDARDVIMTWRTGEGL